MATGWEVELANLVNREWIVLPIIVAVIAGLIIWWVENKTSKYQN